ncbi:integrating conjugative element protein [Rodentibacter trehalosifermentans]|nr:integrating conjugative element protein [Rodentibacter trehalosifermentans]
MKANKAFYVIGGITFFVVLMMVVFLFSGGSSNSAETKENVLDISLNDLSPEELRAMGLEGDTSKDTVRTLIGKVKENNRRFDEVISQNDRLAKENERLKNQTSNTDYQIQQAVQAETGALLAEINSLKNQVLQAGQQMTGNIQRPADNAPLPINGASSSSIIETHGGMSWVNPSDMRTVDDKGNPLPIGVTGVGIGFPKMFNDDINTIKNATNLGTGSANTGNTSGLSTATPFFTIAANSTLTNSIAMTALVGRVPIDNNVTEPYPFKLLIGRDNLIANGIELPDIEGAIVSGTASGDWTLSCVRGDVKSLTFVFSDGRIVSTKTNGSKENDDIGWLSDPHGVPCIPGERKTNAPEYLTTNFLLTGASAAAQGLSSSQSTTIVDGGAVIGAVTGDNGKYILGQALGGGLKETANWFRQRYGQTFDAVYVPPGREVAVHIDKQIDIDYDRMSRKVKYGQASKQANLD